MEKRARKKKSGGLWIHLFLVAFCVFVVAGVYWQYREYRQLKVELADVEQQIADEQQKTLDLHQPGTIKVFKKRHFFEKRY